MMKKRAMTRASGWLCLIVCLALALSGCDSNAEGNPGLIVYRVLDSSGKGPGPEMVVSDTSGKELHRVALPVAPQQLVATNLSNQALARTPDGKLYLLDAREGKVRELEVPGEASGEVLYRPAQFAYSSGKTWTILGDVLMRTAYLANLSTGQVTNLAPVLGDPNVIASGLFSPGETHVALLADAALWLVPTGEPAKARKLADRSYAPSFSSDGKQAAYSIDSLDGSEVVLEQVDGTSSRVIATGERGLSATFVPGQPQLVLVQPGKVTLHSLADGKEQALLTYEGKPGARWLSPNGQKLLFDSDADGEHTWHLLDLKGGAARQLDPLKGYQPYLSGDAVRWLVFAESFGPGSASRFLSLDLESGDTQEVLVLRENQQYLGPLVTSPDGAYTLVASQADNKQQLWLLRNKGGEPRMLAEGSTVSGSISPDGRSAAVSSIEDKGGTYTASLTIVETEGDNTRPLAPGYDPVWLQP